jgi:hypothetical protein
MHTEFRGRRLGIQQVVWLYLSMPPKASPYGLLSWIASTLDFILKTNYQADVERARNHTAQVRVIARALAIHAVGVIFCDEVQNIGVGSETERGVLENTLQELINYTHTRWVFIGTRDGLASVKSGALLRRMCGERGRINWKPLEKISPEKSHRNSPSGEYDPQKPLREGDWEEFVRRLWDWQVTVVPTPLDEKISDTILRLTGGVPDYAKRLFTAAQSLVIGKKQFPDEQLTPDILIEAMKNSFAEEFRIFDRKAQIKKNAGRQ